MDRDQLEMLNAIQALEFTAVEFNLYLDNHPGDQRALLDYCNTTQQLKQLTDTYTSTYGPLLPSDSLNAPCWRWVEEPWPWEIDY